MTYTLNLDENGRYLSSCDSSIWNPPGHPVVDSLPSGDTEEEQNLHNWLYINSEWIYNPLQKEPEPAPALTVWDELDAAYQEGVDSV